MLKWMNLKVACGGLLLIAFLIAGVFPSHFTKYGPFDTDVWHRWDLAVPAFPPSGLHWLGTGDFGRDTYTQLLYGVLPTLRDATILVLLTLALASLIAIVTTLYKPKFLRFVLDTISRTMTLIPPLVLAILALEIPQVYFSEHSAWWYYCVIGILETGRLVQIIEGDLRLISEKPFIEGAVTAGNSQFRIFRVHMMRWLWPYLIEYIPAQYARILTVVGELAYFGMFSNVVLVQGEDTIHVQTTELDWSAMIAIGGHNWFSVPGVVFFTTLAFCLLVLAFRLVSSGIGELSVQEQTHYWAEDGLAFTHWFRRKRRKSAKATQHAFEART